MNFFNFLELSIQLCVNKTKERTMVFRNSDMLDPTSIMQDVKVVKYLGFVLNKRLGKRPNRKSILCFLWKFFKAKTCSNISQ